MISTPDSKSYLAKLSSHTDTLKETSNLIYELFKTGEIMDEQQYRNALDKFQT